MKEISDLGRTGTTNFFSLFLKETAWAERYQKQFKGTESLSSVLCCQTTNVSNGKLNVNASGKDFLSEMIQPLAKQLQVSAMKSLKKTLTENIQWALTREYNNVLTVVIFLKSHIEIMRGREDVYISCRLKIFKVCWKLLGCCDYYSSRTSPLTIYIHAPQGGLEP